MAPEVEHDIVHHQSRPGRPNSLLMQRLGATRRLRAAGAMSAVLAVLVAVAVTGCGKKASPPQVPSQQASFTWRPTPDTPAITKLRAAAKGANVVIVIIDAARADSLGCYGYPRETTPNIDRLAGESVLFEQHFCQYPRTDASTVSLFTGQYPDTHLQGRRDGDVDLIRIRWTLPGALRAVGYHTAFFASRPLLASSFGASGLFETVETGFSGREGLAVSLQPESLLPAISSWLDRRPAAPFFAYIHFVPPHRPYSAPPEIEQLFAGSDPPNAWEGDYPFPSIKPGRPGQAAGVHPPLKEWVNKYDANLRWGDWAVGRVEKLFRDAGLLDNTLLIVTSDHGEAFGEHGYTYHGYGVYDELVHIPLVMRLPGQQAPKQMAALTQTVDIAPTILDILNMTCERTAIQGRSFLPLITGDAESVNDYVFARAAGDPPSYLVRDQRWALLLYQGAKLRALYDLQADPNQKHNLFREAPDAARRLEETFAAFASTQRIPPLEFLDPAAEPVEVPSVRRTKLSEEELEELRALGYLK